MMSVRSIFLAALLLVATPALAQQSIQAQMSADEFKAAGLDKLSTDELARLDAWLDRTIVDETGKAAAVAEERVKKEHRGFATFGSDEPVKGHIPGEFRGFQQGATTTLDQWPGVAASRWRARLAGATPDRRRGHHQPEPAGTAWYMQVGKYNTPPR